MSNSPNNSTRTRLSTGAAWESLVGYSRAVRAGNIIEVSGTTATQNGEIVAPGDAYGQTKYILHIIARSLEQMGASTADVVRTRLYVTDISQWEAVGRAHAEVFGEIRPACSMVEVKALIDPRLLVEIEASAVVNS